MAEHQNFRTELTALLNHYSRENVSNTPDFILATFLLRCLGAFEDATLERETWYGHRHAPGQAASDSPAQVESRT